MLENPFADGSSRILQPPPTAMVIFGATGDLTQRKLIPALYVLAEDGFLPSNFLLVGASRSQLSDDDFRAMVHESLKEHSHREIKSSVWEEFSRSIHFHPTDVTDPQALTALGHRVRDLCQSSGTENNVLFYLATAPRFYGPFAENLRASGIAADLGEPKVIVEKPFGRDRETASELNNILLSSFDESQIFRIDHYLGKETVQNILVFRFANGIFEPLWNHKYIDHIQISVCETIGVGNRAGYFDNTGIVRDIVQNHLLQMLSLVCIEPPHSLSDADSIRDEKVKVLRSIRRLSAGDVRKSSVRARYISGKIAGETVPGYLEEEGVSEDSQTETFAALKFEIDNWRWTGVPIFVRVGKRMPKRITEISIVFKQPPMSLFEGRQIDSLESNVLAIQVQPNEGISLKIGSKPPGMRMRVRPVVLDFHYDNSFGRQSPEAYERLLLDSMRGDATLFTRNDEIEEAWGIVDPILNSWGSSRNSTLFEYKSGSWGPKAGDDLLAPGKRSWRRL